MNAHACRDDPGYGVQVVVGRCGAGVMGGAAAW